MGVVDNLLGLLLLNSFLLSLLTQQILLKQPALAGLHKELSLALFVLTLATLTLGNISWFLLDAYLPQQLQPLDVIVWLGLYGFLWSFGFLLLRSLLKALWQLPTLLALVCFVNCVILGDGVIRLSHLESAGQIALASIVISLGLGVGYITCNEFSQRLANSNIPRPWRGAPIYMVSAALASAGVVGFSGLL